MSSASVTEIGRMPDMGGWDASWLDAAANCDDLGAGSGDLVDPDGEWVDGDVTVDGPSDGGGDICSVQAEPPYPASHLHSAVAFDAATQTPVPLQGIPPGERGQSSEQSSRTHPSSQRHLASTLEQAPWSLQMWFPEVPGHSSSHVTPACPTKHRHDPRASWHTPLALQTCFTTGPTGHVEPRDVAQSRPLAGGMQLQTPPGPQIPVPLQTRPDAMGHACSHAPPTNPDRQAHSPVMHSPLPLQREAHSTAQSVPEYPL
jgi:hypothetical protein